MQSDLRWVNTKPASASVSVCATKDFRVERTKRIANSPLPFEPGTQPRGALNTHSRSQRPIEQPTRHSGNFAVVLFGFVSVFIPSRTVEHVVQRSVISASCWTLPAPRAIVAFGI